MTDIDTQLLAEAYENINKPKPEISIFDFIDMWKNEGYGLALISPDDIVVDAYIDPSDYPDMVLSSRSNGAHAIDAKYNGYYIKFHSGSLENCIGKDWYKCGVEHNK